MGVLIHLSERPARPASRRREGETADILLYTGVRYERHAAEEPTPGDGAGRETARPRRRRRG